MAKRTFKDIYWSFLDSRIATQFFSLLTGGCFQGEGHVSFGSYCLFSLCVLCAMSVGPGGVCSSVSHHFIFGDKISPWPRSLPNYHDTLTARLRDLPVTSSTAWYYKHVLLHPAWLWGAGDSNSGPQAGKVSSLAVVSISASCRSLHSAD